MSSVIKGNKAIKEDEKVDFCWLILFRSSNSSSYKSITSSNHFDNI